MFRLTTEESIDSAHFLAGYEGKCRHIHGHRWRIVVTLQSEALRDDTQQRGMCVDFSDVKEDLKNLLSDYDHTLMIEKGSLKSATMAALKDEGFPILELNFRPTAENLALHFFEKMTSLGYDIYSVQVYETPNNSATYINE